MPLQRLRSRFDVFGWYDQIKRSDQPVAWCSAFAPAEALLAMGIQPVFPENHAAMLGALSPRRDPDTPFSRSAIALAEFVGYGFPKLCTYALADIGAMIDKAGSPIHGLPPADLFYACDSQCSVVGRWGEAVSKRLEREGRTVPHYLLRAPPLVRAEAHTMEEIDRFEDQLRMHLERIGRDTGTSFDEAKLAEVLNETNEANALWQTCLGMAMRQPAAWSITDAFQAMAPIVIARGTRACTEFYAQLLAELQQRQYRKKPALEDERVRLLWDAIPIWPRKNWLAKFCAERGALFTASTYTSSWWFEFDLERPLRSLCERYAWNTMNRSAAWVLDWTLQLYRAGACDGIVCHWNESCGIWNSYVKRRLPGYEREGIPHIVIHADMVDARAFDEAAISAQLGGFIDELAAAKVAT